MADINKFIPIFFRWEERFAEDVRLMTKYEYDVVEYVLRPYYWDVWQADKIQSQALANILVDWLWRNGRHGITITQGILGVNQDGIVGEKTLAVLNTYPDYKELFDKIQQVRKAYINMICLNNPKSKRFKKDWLSRLNNIKFLPEAAVHDD